MRNENSTEKGMTLTGINQALNECPPVIPTVSEDCISRAEMLDTYAELYDVFDDYPNIIEELHKVYDKLNGLSNAISRAEGEWIEHKLAEEYDGLLKPNYECSQCHDWLREQTNYCPNCGAKMKGADNE